MKNLSDPNTASVRTGWSVTVIAAIVYLVSKFTDFEIATDDPMVIIAAGAVVGFGHRLFQVLSERIPVIGYVLFGINKSPGYADPPPVNPPIAEPPPQDNGFVDLQTIVVMFAVAVLVVAATIFLSENLNF